MGAAMMDTICVLLIAGFAGICAMIAVLWFIEFLGRD
jgi:hypothetical protein